MWLGKQLSTFFQSLNKDYLFALEQGVRPSPSPVELFNRECVDVLYQYKMCSSVCGIENTSSAALPLINEALENVKATLDLLNLPLSCAT